MRSSASPKTSIDGAGQYRHNSSVRFPRNLASNCKVLLQLVENDLMNQYLGSFLGIVWAFIQPLFFIGAIWFVFSTGLRGTRMSGDVPYLLYLMSGMIVWNFFSASVTGAEGSISQHRYLVKQMVFQVRILPVVKILSAMIIHFIFLVLVMILFLFHGFSLSAHSVQLAYYLFATSVLAMGISMITSSVVLFFRDLSQITQIIVRIGFWFTPIFWNISRIPAKYQFLIKANPVYYLVTGYRDCLIYKVWFWKHLYLTLYFWAVTLAVFVLGTIVFRKLKPHFADVL
jgi:lipopolysaccharide transport system permease protein/teichoic acid transport system permease protein